MFQTVINLRFDSKDGEEDRDLMGVALTIHHVLESLIDNLKRLLGKKMSRESLAFFHLVGKGRTRSVL